MIGSFIYVEVMIKVILEKRVFKTTSRDQRHILCVKVTLIVDLHIVSFSAPSQQAAMIILKGVFSNLLNI